MRAKRSKVQEVYDAIKDLASTYDLAAKLPPVRTLAERYSVSLATLTQALDRLEEDGLIRRKAGSGIFVPGAEHGGEILILAEPTVMIGASPFWSCLLRHLAKPLVDQGLTPEVHLTTPYLTLADHSAGVDALLPDRVRRAIESGAVSCVLAVSVDEAVLRWIESKGTPTVSYGTSSRYTVVMATLEACQLGVNELVRLGCKRIAVWSALTLAQHEVFHATLAAHSLQAVMLHQPNVAEVDQRAILTPPDLVNEGYDACMRAFSVPESERPDGALSLSGTFTLGVLMALNRLGLSAGVDVQVASPVNKGVPTLRGWEHQIVRMEFSPEAAAAAMLEAADCLLRGEEVRGEFWDRAAMIAGGDSVAYVRPVLHRPSTQPI